MRQLSARLNAINVNSRDTPKPHASNLRDAEAAQGPIIPGTAQENAFPALTAETDTKPGIWRGVEPTSAITRPSREEEPRPKSRRCALETLATSRRQA